MTPTEKRQEARKADGLAEWHERRAKNLRERALELRTEANTEEREPLTEAERLGRILGRGYA